jgi:pilus assembly protein Flp/PilA
MNRLTAAYIWLKIWKDENGQDLVEYALAVALIAFAAVVGMETLAKGINNAFNNIANTLETYLPGAGGSST